MRSKIKTGIFSDSNKNRKFFSGGFKGLDNSPTYTSDGNNVILTHPDSNTLRSILRELQSDEKVIQEKDLPYAEVYLSQDYIDNIDMNKDLNEVLRKYKFFHYESGEKLFSRSITNKTHLSEWTKIKNLNFEDRSFYPLGEFVLNQLKKNYRFLPKEIENAPYHVLGGFTPEDYVYRNVEVKQVSDNFADESKLYHFITYNSYSKVVRFDSTDKYTVIEGQLDSSLNGLIYLGIDFDKAKKIFDEYSNSLKLFSNNKYRESRIKDSNSEYKELITDKTYSKTMFEFVFKTEYTDLSRLAEAANEINLVSQEETGEMSRSYKNEKGEYLTSKGAGFESEIQLYQTLERLGITREFTKSTLPELLDLNKPFKAVGFIDSEPMMVVFSDKLEITKLFGSSILSKLTCKTDIYYVTNVGWLTSDPTGGKDKPRYSDVTLIAKKGFKVHTEEAEHSPQIRMVTPFGFFGIDESEVTEELFEINWSKTFSDSEVITKLNKVYIIPEDKKFTHRNKVFTRDSISLGKEDYYSDKQFSNIELELGEPIDYALELILKGFKVIGIESEGGVTVGFLKKKNDTTWNNSYAFYWNPYADKTVYFEKLEFSSGSNSLNFSKSSKGEKSYSYKESLTNFDRTRLLTIKRAISKLLDSSENLRNQKHSWYPCDLPKKLQDKLGTLSVFWFNSGGLYLGCTQRGGFVDHRVILIDGDEITSYPMDKAGESQAWIVCQYLMTESGSNFRHNNKYKFRSDLPYLEFDVEDKTYTDTKKLIELRQGEKFTYNDRIYSMNEISQGRAFVYNSSKEEVSFSDLNKEVKIYSDKVGFLSGITLSTVKARYYPGAEDSWAEYIESQLEDLGIEVSQSLPAEVENNVRLIKSKLSKTKANELFEKSDCLDIFNNNYSEFVKYI